MYEGGEADTSVQIPTSELDAERRRLAMLNRYSDDDSTKKSRSRRKRRPRAGHYPIGFSPYQMTAKRGGVVPLARGLVRNDCKVYM